MSFLKLPAGLSFRVDVTKPADDFDAGILGPEDGLEASIRYLLGERETHMKTFRETVAKEPDPTLFELVEEWDQTTRKVRWYYRKR